MRPGHRQRFTYSVGRQPRPMTCGRNPALLSRPGLKDPVARRSLIGIALNVEPSLLPAADQVPTIDADERLRPSHGRVLIRHGKTWVVRLLAYDHASVRHDPAKLSHRAEVVRDELEDVAND